jgi:magnesium transporter
MQIIKTSALTWVNLESPTFKDIHALTRDFRINPALATRLKDPIRRPVVEDYQKFLYVVLHFPMYDEEAQTSKSAELDFILTPTALLTTHYQRIEPLEQILKRAASMPYKSADHHLSKGPFFLFYHIVKELFNFSLREIDHIHEKIDEIEACILDGREKEMVPRISKVRRDIINFASTIEPQRMALEGLMDRREFADEFTRPYIVDLSNEYHKVLNLIRAKKETIEALHDTNHSLLQAKTNEITKNLTIMAFITFPLMLFTSLFGMNTQTLPIVGYPGDFWIIVGIMVAVTFGFFVFFKAKKWI